MEMTRLAAIMIIVGFIIFWVGNVYSPPRIYQEADLEVRLQLVSQYPSRWALSQGLGGVGIGLALLGLLVFSIDLAGDYAPWLTYLPAALNILAAILVALYLYQYITDPIASWTGSGQPLLILIASILMMVAGILLGILFLQTGLPGWLSYLTIGYSAIALIAIVVARPPSFYVISIYFFIILALGIALLWQQSTVLIDAV